MTICLRILLDVSYWPMVFSLVLYVFRIQFEYTCAVSMKLPPNATNSSSKAADSVAEIEAPNSVDPKHICEICKCVPGISRYFIIAFLFGTMPLYRLLNDFTEF